MNFRIRLPNGTLKFKSYRYLRSFERDRHVPTIVLGAVHIIWVNSKSKYFSD